LDRVRCGRFGTPVPTADHVLPELLELIARYIDRLFGLVG
jgi:hypothetical protein